MKQHSMNLSCHQHHRFSALSAVPIHCGSGTCRCPGCAQHQALGCHAAVLQSVHILLSYVCPSAHGQSAQVLVHAKYTLLYRAAFSVLIFPSLKFVFSKEG